MIEVNNFLVGVLNFRKLLCKLELLKKNLCGTEFKKVVKKNCNKCTFDKYYCLLKTKL